MQSELKQITNLALFAKVVQTGGISRCATDLGVERTTVSRRIGELEKRLGVKLLTRSPKAVAVTEAGRLCFNQCEQILEIAKSAETAATRGRSVVNADPIVLGSPPDIIEHLLGSAVADFEADHPSSSIVCRPTFGDANGLSDEIDISISWNSLNPTDYLVSRIGEFDQAAYASVDYISRRGVPQSPDDLHQHTRIEVNSTCRRNAWRFVRDGFNYTLPAHADIEVANMLDGVSSTLAGLGVCLLPKVLCERHTDTGRLVRVLPDYKVAPRELFLVAPRQASHKPRVTTLRIFLEKRLSEFAAKGGRSTTNLRNDDGGMP